jgi:fucose permease
LFSRLLTMAGENGRTAVFLCGLLLLASGLAILSTAAALIVPGALLVWLAIPPAARQRKPS